MSREFDPYGVPAQPVVSIDFQVDPHGAEHALVDRAAVSPRPGESPRTAAMREVAERIVTIAPGGASGTPQAHGVRVLLNGPGLHGYEAVIDRQGRLFVPVGSAASPRRAEPGSLVALAQEAFDRADARDGAPRTLAPEQVPDPAREHGTDESWSPTFLDVRAQIPEVREIPSVTDIAQTDGSDPTPSRTTSSADDRLLSLLTADPDLRSDPRPHSRPTAAATPEPQPERSRALRVRPAVIAVIVAALLASGGLAAIVIGLSSSRAGLLSSDPSSTTPAARPFPGTPPAGFAATPRWISEPVQTGRVTSLGSAIAYLTTSGRLTVRDAMTGATRWSVALPSGGPTIPPARTRIDGQEVLATQVGSTLAWWRLDDGRPAGTLTLPAQARTTFLGEAPLVGLDTHTVAVVSRGDLKRVTVPAGAYPLAATATGRVTAASSRGWWHLRPGTAPGAVQPWEDPARQEQAPGATPGVVGYLGSSVLLLYPADRTGQLHVVAHTDREQDLRVSFRGRVAAVPEVTQPWWPSPNGTWGVLGRTIVDLKAGRVADLGDWRTTWMTQEHAYGTVEGQPSQADAAGTVGATPQGATIPEVVTSAGAAVRARGAEGESLYLLPPD